MDTVVYFNITNLVVVDLIKICKENMIYDLFITLKELMWPRGLTFVFPAVHGNFTEGSLVYDLFIP